MKCVETCRYSANKQVLALDCQILSMCFFISSLDAVPSALITKKNGLVWCKWNSRAPSSLKMNNSVFTLWTQRKKLPVARQWCKTSTCSIICLHRLCSCWFFLVFALKQHQGKDSAGGVRGCGGWMWSGTIFIPFLAVVPLTLQSVSGVAEDDGRRYD